MSEDSKLLDERDKRGAIAWMAGNSVTSNLLMLVFLIGGFIYAWNIKQEVFPSFERDEVNITVSYPGASPEEVEQGIILAIEEKIRGLEGIDEVSSVAREGGCTITAELLLGVDNQKLKADIEQEVDSIQSFPEDAEEPSVTVRDSMRRAISIVVYGDLNDVALRELTEQVRERFLANDNITYVELSGIRPLEIAIEIPQDKLREHNLTLGGVADVVGQAIIDLPGGGIKTESGEVLVRMKERRDYGLEFQDIPVVSSEKGNELLLGDIADIVDGFEETDYYATFNGKRAIRMDIYRVGEETPMQVATAVKELMEEIELPPTCGMAIIEDRSAMYLERMDLLLRNALLGLALVFVLLGVFLEARLAFWVTMGIPISFLGAFLFLPIIGVTINMVSLFAFIVALGIVVDDAIVVGENIYQHHQEGMPFIQAAMKGAREMAMPVTFSVLTNIAAFMPLFFVPGIMGKIFKSIPAVVIMVFAISLAESLFILPAHLGHASDKKRYGISAWIHGNQRAFSDWFRHLIRDRFGPFHDWILEHRYLTISIALMILLVTIGYVGSGRLGMVNFPKVESDYAIVTAMLPYGAAVEDSTKVKDRLVKAAREIVEENGGEKLSKGVYAQVGGAGRHNSGSHVVEVSIILQEAGVRPISTSDVTKIWRERVGEIAGLDILKFEADRGGPGSGSSMTVELSHTDINVLEKASGKLAGMLLELPQVKDIDDGFSPGKPQFDFKILPSGRSLGLTAENIARQVRNSFYGAEVTRQQRGRNEVKVRVRLPKAERVSEFDLEQMMIKTPDGVDVPLSEVVSVKRGRAYTAITRREGRRTVSVQANVVPNRDTDMVLKRVKDEMLPVAQSQFPGLQYSFEGRQAEIQESVDALRTGLLLALFVIYVLLAIPFNSYAQPLIIMVSIPFGVVGAVIGHIIMDYPMSIISMMGVVALSGVVVNDALILIDYANIARKDGLKPYDAVHQAAIRRFRPIMLTTLTTFGGLAPMIFETSRQARFLIPMALSLGYGILFATLISLLLVPCLYLAIEDAHEAWRRW